MTVFSLPLLGNHPASVSFGGAFVNLAMVTIVNIIGGAGFVALGYLGASSRKTRGALAPAPAE
jgi:nitrite transporter NirC